MEGTARKWFSHTYSIGQNQFRSITMNMLRKFGVPQGSKLDICRAVQKSVFITVYNDWTACGEY